jgi:hypothetical protein
MSRLPYQAVPADPIEGDIQVCTMSQPLQTFPDGCAITTFPTAVKENSPDPITVIPIVHLDTLFDYQCLDPVACRRGQSLLVDPSWDYDRHGFLRHRSPSGEVEVYIPHALRQEGPCSIIHPIAEDGSILSWGVISDQAVRNRNPPQEHAIRDRTPAPRILLKRGQDSTNQTSLTLIGLATLTQWNER